MSFESRHTTAAPSTAIQLHPNQVSKSNEKKKKLFI